MKSVIRKAKVGKYDERAVGMKSLKSDAHHILQQKDKDTEELTEKVKRQKLDPLTEQLGCTSYYHKMRWGWFKKDVCGVKYSLEVTRYYQEKKLAIDIGRDGFLDQELKKELLMQNGIKYYAIESAGDVGTLLSSEAHL